MASNRNLGALSFHTYSCISKSKYYDPIKSVNIDLTTNKIDGQITYRYSESEKTSNTIIYVAISACILSFSWVNQWILFYGYQPNVHYVHYQNKPQIHNKAWQNKLIHWKQMNNNIIWYDSHIDITKTGLIYPFSACTLLITIA